MDLSNKSLAMLLVAAMVISFGSTTLTLNKLREGQGPVFVGGGADLSDSTAMVAGSGWTAVAITGFTGCNVDTNVDFGTNQTPSSTLTISSDTANTGGGVTFNDCSSTGV